MIRITTRDSLKLTNIPNNNTCYLFIINELCVKLIKLTVRSVSVAIGITQFNGSTQMQIKLSGQTLATWSIFLKSCLPLILSSSCSSFGNVHLSFEGVITTIFEPDIIKNRVKINEANVYIYTHMVKAGSWWTLNFRNIIKL